MMIGSKDLVTLLSLLSEEDKPLETVSTTFNRTFNRADQFKIGCAIYTMMKDGFIRVQSHRLISFYILYSLFNHGNTAAAAAASAASSSSGFTSPIQQSANTTSTSNSSNNNNENENEEKTGDQDNSSIFNLPIAFNPFLPVFIDELQKYLNNNNNNNNQNNQNNNNEIQSPQHKAQQQVLQLRYNSLIEKHYLIQFLTNLPKDFSKKTSKELVQQTPTNELTVPNLNDYRKFYLDKLAHYSFPSLRSIGVSPSLFFSDFEPITPFAIVQQQQSPKQQLKDLKISEQELSLFSFEPAFHRPPPPLFNPINTIWINTTINHGLLLSPLATLRNGLINPKKIVRDLMSKAIRTRLAKIQTQQIKVELENDPKLVLYSGLVPKKLPNLVENNTQVAIEALLKLIHSPDFKDYFQELISMEMNYRSMEVVNALATSVELPQHFIPMYISNCIATCNNSKDKVMLQRSVRLVCVFIQSLIRNNIINIKDLFTEVQSFCLEHSKIREAISLFKLMNDEKTGSSSSTTSTITTIDNK
ncbi:hypothetical protein DFA_01241 [Cavenderia fasciculata]|uniref:CCR4-NOT transcription complex subunit 11 n=1 Tax=Cavenderia fasciculata TaxID=261658 RepID=F4PRM0_CACFS|nr:uncharacterized protein DFA_01241 [Cavenderia fasciculata]EGG21360.1 hypothetical protein DFA_01241 [Cavenderia fasciculata]|eukprot:XP_004359210.1 hypothetical protein DFA_01241 [Cavenderia fasciculata]